MACNSLTALPRSCSDGVIGGLEQVFIMASKDLSSGTTTPYSATTEGVISSVDVEAGKKFVEIGLLKSTSGLSEALTKDNTKGINYFTQTFTLVVGDLSSDNYNFIQDIKSQPVVVIYKTRNDKYFIIGLNKQLEVATIEGGTGIAENDLVGYTITFTGVSRTPAPLMDESLISTLTA